MSYTTFAADYRINALLGGTRWSGTTGSAATLSYSIPTAGAYWTANYGNDREPSYAWTPLNSAQSSAFRLALTQWSEVANVTFAPRTESGSYVGDVRVAFSPVVATQGAAAWAYVPPTAGYVAEAGDVWLNPTYADYSPGTYGFVTLLHELGHALGLKHPFASTSYSTTLLTGAEDTTQYSLMSYTEYAGAGYTYTATGGGRYSYTEVLATTPMLYDMLTIQYLYGANTGTRAGDDTYTFSNTQGELKTIWDAGGVDTFDLSNQTLGMIIDLNAGHYSSLGVRQTTYQGALSTASNNIAIAFGANIENAIGGSGPDTLYGNALSNVLRGGADNDSLQGAGGTDTLDGGAGIDTAVFTGDRSQYTIAGSGVDKVVVSSSAEGIDTLMGVESLRFSNQSLGLGTIPTLAVDVTKTPIEGNSNHINWFLLQLGSPLTQVASVNYQTRDGTAAAGSDYYATSGTASIAQGDISTIIGVEIIGDAVSENDEVYYLDITSPVGASFPGEVLTLTAIRTIINDDGSVS